MSRILGQPNLGFIGALMLAALMSACSNQAIPATATPRMTPADSSPTAAIATQSATVQPLAAPTVVAPQATDAPTTVVREEPLAVPVEAGCMGELRFLAVVNYPDRAHVGIGEIINKQWRIRNESNCALGVGYTWRFVDDPAGTLHDFGQPVLTMPQDIPPRSDYDLAVDLEMPFEPGLYAGRWQMITPDGVALEEYIQLRVQVQ